MRGINPEDIVYLWWCPGCPLKLRWQVMNQTEWLEHIATHLSRARAEYLIQRFQLPDGK